MLLWLQEMYVLHDGPPYANGDLHIGEDAMHAYVRFRMSNAQISHAGNCSTSEAYARSVDQDSLILQCTEQTFPGALRL